MLGNSQMGGGRSVVGARGRAQVRAAVLVRAAHHSLPPNVFPNTTPLAAGCAPSAPRPWPSSARGARAARLPPSQRRVPKPVRSRRASRPCARSSGAYVRKFCRYTFFWDKFFEVRCSACVRCCACARAGRGAVQPFARTAPLCAHHAPPLPPPPRPADVLALHAPLPVISGIARGAEMCRAVQQLVLC